jgi:hypothetical protein
MDQSAMRFGEGELKSIVPPGSSALVNSPVHTLYLPRVDIVGAISCDTPLAIRIMTPEQRKMLGVKGWRKEHVLGYLKRQLAPSVNQLEGDVFAIVVDKALRISPKDVVDAMHAGGCRRAKFAWLMPTAAAKYISPLDNNLWHEWKERVRKRKPKSVPGLAYIMRQEWWQQSTENICSYYRHCGLMQHADSTRGIL